MNSKKGLARIAGGLYLLLIVCGIFAEFFVRSKILIRGNAAATFANIKTHEGLYRLGFASDIVMLITYFFLPLFLYLLLHQIHKNSASLMVLCVMVAVAIMGVNMLNHLAPLQILNHAEALAALEENQRQALALFFLSMHGQGYVIAQVFFGLWLFPLGFLVYRAAFLPKLIGLMLMIGSIGYLLDFFLYVLFPSFASSLAGNLTVPADLGEISLCLWLLVKGV